MGIRVSHWRKCNPDDNDSLHTETFSDLIHSELPRRVQALELQMALLQRYLCAATVLEQALHRPAHDPNHSYTDQRNVC